MYNYQLETFIKVADSGSFSKAGEILFITPTAVMKQINILEEKFGIELFIRSPRGLKLTEAGKIIYEEAKYIIKYSDKVIERAKKIEMNNKNIVRVGTSLMTPETKLIEIWTKIKDKISNIKLQIIPFENNLINAKEILNNMGKDIDIIVSIHDDNLLNAKNCSTTKLFDLPICVGIPITHKLSTKEKLEIEDLFGENIMLIHRGWSKDMDKLRNKIEKDYQKINIIDFGFFSLEIFNQCENSNNILILTNNFSGVHPLIKLIPVNWNFKTTFSLIHAAKPTKVVEKFIREMVKGVNIKI